VEFEKMTWVEVKAALAAGKTTAAELGKRAFDMKVDYAVRQIRRLLSTS
jgi:hypothetical protein